MVSSLFSQTERSHETTWGHIRTCSTHSHTSAHLTKTDLRSGWPHKHAQTSFRIATLSHCTPFLHSSGTCDFDRRLLELLAQVRQPREEHVMKHPTFYRTTLIDGLSIFYREAGPKDALTILLLHGLPSSSRMFEPLFARLSDHYHLVAPDYPGFGHSDWPDSKNFAYTFDHIADIITHFTESLGLARYTLYMQDYGGPVGFRMALAHPDRVEALIVQDAVAHNEGLGANWKTRREFWKNRAANEGALRTNLLSLQTTRTRHVGDDPNVERYDPDLWTDEFAFLSQPAQADIQSDLFYDYRTNVDAYPRWQSWLREHEPRLLVIWGKHDLSFDPSESEAYQRDV